MSQLLDAIAEMRACATSVSAANPVFLDCHDKSTALGELSRLEAQVAELRLRVMASADDVAATTGARDIAAWLAADARRRPENTRGDLRLAEALDRRWPLLREAMARGEANAEQAAVVARSLDELPDDVPADLLELAEKTLVAHCADFAPAQLARLGRRILDVVAPELADAAEAARLAALEAEAHRKTRLTLRRCGDGTTHIAGRLPDHAATRLATYLEAFASPRRHPDGVPAPDELTDPVRRLSYPRRVGAAFVQLLECLDPDRLPLHGGDATTLVVTIDLRQLRDELGAADLLTSGTVPGDDPTDHRLSAREARRLACNARILPAVLGGAGEVLDLGRAQRLFTATQRRALLLRDRTCRAESCDVPGTWSEAHHWLPWSAGGPTDLENALLLCSHHHHRAHDPGYRHERLPTGDVRFHRRR